MTQDPSHATPDAQLTAQQHRAMPKTTKPDECAKLGKTECDDEECQHYNRGCPMSGRKPATTGKPTERI